MKTSSDKRANAVSVRALAVIAVTMVTASFVSSDFAAAAAARQHLKHRYEQSHHAQSNVQPHPQVQSSQGALIVDEQNNAEIFALNQTDLFNPASNTKLATSLAVLRKFGADYRFRTEIRTSGSIVNGELQGDLYVSGDYMLFGDREADELLKILRDKGIKSVKGDLYVTDNFAWDVEDTGLAAGAKLKKYFSPPPIKRKGHVIASARLTIGGQVKVGAPPAGTTLIATHNSPPLKHILKRMLCPSDNAMAERFGEMIGGPQGLTQFVLNDVGAAPGEAAFASTSGLYVNRVSPEAMMKVLVALKAQLAKDNLTFADIMPVSGIDSGTMHNRLNSGKQEGSVIAKTGTLPDTDNGASALSGEMHTTTGTYLFVLFEIHGSVGSFKSHENDRVTDFQDRHGGAKSIVYKPILPGFAAEAFWN